MEIHSAKGLRLPRRHLTGPGSPRRGRRQRSCGRGINRIGPGRDVYDHRVGIPYVDLSAVRKFGITLDQGSFPDAYNALISNLNADGGIDGRHLVPYLVAVNPVGTAPAMTACTQLAEDDKVFVAINPEQPDCFLQQYHVPTIAGSLQNVQSSR